MPGRAAILAAGLLLLAQVPPGAAQTTEQRLERAERKAREIARDLAAARSRLETLRAVIEGLTTQIVQAQAQEAAIREEIEAAERALRRKGERVEALRERLEQRAREIYMAGPPGVLEFVLEADSLLDLADRVSFLDMLSRTDASAAAGLVDQQADLDRYQETLGGLREQQDALLEELARQDERLQRKFAQQTALTRRMERRFAAAERLVSSLELQRRREILAALAARLASGAPLRPGQGLLEACPVDPPRSYINDFGFPRVGHTHQGNDIFAPAGTPIRASIAGVAEERTGGLGGLSVYVRAPDGTFVYNAHMSRFAGVDGKVVEPGDLIGYVGNTGNAVGTPPHNHFELHPMGGSAINPYAHLNLVCGVNGSG